MQIAIKVFIIKSFRGGFMSETNEAYRCPLCGQTSRCEIKGKDDFYTEYYCKTLDRTFRLADESILASPNREELLDLIVEHLLKPKINKDDADVLTFYCNETDYEEKGCVNLYSKLKLYPTATLDLVNRSLINLTRFYDYEKIFRVYSVARPILSRLTFRKEIFIIMTELGYLRAIDSNNYTISASGWLKAEELIKKNDDLKQAFIAMSFANIEELKNIRETFKKAIAESGYEPRIIDEKEHNNQIVPEIIYEIKHSKFLVVDVTYPNNGAYYEAGIGFGLGKEVICCCKREALDGSGTYTRPHFDISQKSLVVWEDQSDLLVKLKRRIEATVQ